MFSEAQNNKAEWLDGSKWRIRKGVEGSRPVLLGGIVVELLRTDYEKNEFLSWYGLRPNTSQKHYCESPDVSTGLQSCDMQYWITGLTFRDISKERNTSVSPEI